MYVLMWNTGHGMVNTATVRRTSHDLLERNSTGKQSWLWPLFSSPTTTGTIAYPYPVIDVEAGTCYRLRFIGSMSNAENFIIEVSPM